MREAQMHAERCCKSISETRMRLPLYRTTDNKYPLFLTLVIANHFPEDTAGGNFFVWDVNKNNITCDNVDNDGVDNDNDGDNNDDNCDSNDNDDNDNASSNDEKNSNNNDICSFFFFIIISLQFWEQPITALTIQPTV